MEVHDDEAALGRGHVDLEVVRGPGAAGDGGLAGQHGGPVPLPRHRAHQHEPVLTHGGSQHKRSVERRDAFKYKVSMYNFGTHQPALPADNT